MESLFSFGVEMIKPFIEILKDGCDWSVEGGKPTANLAKKELYIPLDDNEAIQRLSRTRELCKIKLFGELATSDMTDNYELAETVKNGFATKFMVERGIDFESTGFLKKSTYIDLFKQYIDIEDVIGATCHVFDEYGTENFNDIRDDIEKQIEKLDRNNKAVWTRANHRLLWVRNMITHLEHYFINKTNIGSDGASDEDKAMELLSIVDHLVKVKSNWEKAKNQTTDSTKNDNQSLYVDKNTRNDKYLKRLSKDSEDFMDEILRSNETGISNEWGTLTIQKPVKDHYAKRRYLNKTTRSNLEGIYLRHIWRIASDRLIFSQMTKKMGGSVLIDTSSSMNLSTQQINDLVQLAPAISVAIYSGNDNDGVCRELVYNGRKVHNGQIRKPAAGNNVVDGPAIKEWLAKQPMPRVWISDGVVTGIGDRYAFNLCKEVKQLIKNYSIIRVSDFDEAKILFYKLEHFGQQVHPVNILRMKRMING